MAGEGTKNKPGSSLGSVTVSVVFRAVASVGEASPSCHVTTLPVDTREDAQSADEWEDISDKKQCQPSGKYRRGRIPGYKAGGMGMCVSDICTMHS